MRCKCGRQLEIYNSTVDLVGDLPTGIEIEYCPECKKITEITIDGYENEL
jgi:Zn-finger nucleic acid-binding protein